MQIIKNNKNIIHNTFFEFIRYAIVGGISFIADISVLFLFKEFILQNVIYSLYIATAIGFLIGLTVNYFLSLFFVFNAAKGTQTGRSIRDIIIFAVVGIIGLILSETGMFVGSGLFEFNYIYVKVAVTIIVLMWNYTGRKILIFNKSSGEGGSEIYG